jgi:hypothetical protein
MFQTLGRSGDKTNDTLYHFHDTTKFLYLLILCVQPFSKAFKSHVLRTALVLYVRPIHRVQTREELVKTVTR